MLQREPIADYLEALTRELSFDRALSRRVCAEAEDHLWQAIDGCVSLESQRKAVADFGDPRAIARQYATAILLAHIRWVGLAVIGASSAIFLAMKLRVEWYEMMDWKLSAEWETARAVGLALDRCSFIGAITVALVGWVYISTRRAPIQFDGAYSKELNRCIALCEAAAIGLIVSVVMETALAGVRLVEVELCVAASVPILSLVIEMIAAALLVLRIRAMIRRTGAVVSLLET